MSLHEINKGIHKHKRPNRLGRGIATCLAPVARTIQAGVDAGVFRTDDVHLLARWRDR